jgi:uncharacterized circularly permuted ATP-grasp superfamily protein/uncharacterized alpha-E superfamily protein
MGPGESRLQPQAPAVETCPYDEAHAADGGVRPHWNYLMGSLQALSPRALAERKALVERALRDDGATYNDYRSDSGSRDWSLDPMPLLLDSGEWGRIESGVRERAEVLDLVLRDLYGPRQLIKLGIIPAELVFAHRGFLRACQGISLPGEQQLIQYAADMVRAPDGAMRIISDRTQIPSGMGYTLENRRVMSRVFPSLFRDSHVHRLSLYFNSLRLKLNALGPNGGVPRVVMLTPGSYNETYFEHQFLANHLGYSLVQGNDLTVRDGYVWLRTLNGLSRIDVILRRVDDDYCDPVELKPDSQLGVPGLLEVVRSGRVVVANPLGSGVLENSGLLKYLPAAGRHFLGRDLSLEAVPTYWCGDAADLRHTLANMDRLVIKTTYHGSASRTVHGAELSQSEQDSLAERIRARPLDYIAQDYVQPSRAPVWDGGLRPAVLRSFAVAGESSYIVMPGGLTRVATAQGGVEISNRAGSPSKDTWVLASEPEKADALPPVAGPAEGRREATSLDLPSRVVENLFWLGRYVERAESALRLLRIVFSKLGDATPPSPDNRLLLLRAVTQLTCTYPGFMDETLSRGDPQQELLSVVLDIRRTGSVANSVAALFNTVDQVKDFVSADTQRILNGLRDHMQVLPGRLQSGYSPVQEEELDSLVTSLLALAGLIQESMMRGQGWHFLQAGRRIERALQLLSLLRSLWVQCLPERDQAQLLETVLLSMDSLMAYRRRHQRDMDVAGALELLVLDANNPRSVIYQFEQLKSHLAAIPAEVPAGRLSGPERLLLEAGTQLQLAEMSQLARAGHDQYLRSALDQLLARSHHLVSAIAQTINDTCFDHSGGPRPLGPGDWEDGP